MNMTKPGHEAPLNDNINPADLTPHADEVQLRIGQAIPEPEARAEKTLPGLQLTEKEQTRVEGLMNTPGLDRLTAALYTVSGSKARRIIGHSIASRQAVKHEEGVKERKQKEVPDIMTDKELIELIKGSYPSGSDNPKKPSNGAV